MLATPAPLAVVGGQLCTGLRDVTSDLAALDSSGFWVVVLPYDGEPVCACLVAAGQAQGREVVTVEGLADGEQLHPVQQAFVETGAVQCGFCTPGLVVAAHDLLARVPRPSDPEIREALAGNLCRCTGYEKILDAVRLAAERQAAR